MKPQPLKNEPVLTFPTAFSILVNAVLAMLAQAKVLAGDLVPFIVAIVNAAAVVAGLWIARNRVTPVYRAEDAVKTADERARLKLGREVAASRTRAAKAAKKPRP